jgi:hypothetical protein
VAADLADPGGCAFPYCREPALASLLFGMVINPPLFVATLLALRRARVRYLRRLQL